MGNLIKTIDASECLTGSLRTLNTNFSNLDSEACSLKQQIESNRQIRTFFYYGDAQDNTTSKPSNNTIGIFVNSPTQLNVPAISITGDIVYVIYQKTGWLLPGFITINPNSITLDQIPANRSNTDTAPQFAPIFIIWRLTFDGIDYKVDVGFPKYSQASTSASGVFQPGWNDPRTWTTY